METVELQVYENRGEWLRANPVFEYRSAHGLSIREMANEIGASRGSVQYWENGRDDGMGRVFSVPKFAHMRAIAKRLQMTTDELYLRWEQWLFSKPQ